MQNTSRVPVEEGNLDFPDYAFGNPRGINCRSEITMRLKHGHEN